MYSMFSKDEMDSFSLTKLYVFPNLGLLCD